MPANGSPRSYLEQAAQLDQGLPQLEPLDLPSGGLWKRVGEFHPPRGLIRGELALGKRLELFGERVRGFNAALEHDERLGLEQIVLVRLADNRYLEDAGMGDQRRLDLGGRDPLAADLHHVVGSSAVDVVAFGVL